MRPSLSLSPFMARGREESPSSGELLKREKKRLLCNQFTSSSKLVTNSDLLCQIGSAALLLAAEGSASQPVSDGSSHPLLDRFPLHCSQLPRCNLCPEATQTQGVREAKVLSACSPTPAFVWFPALIKGGQRKRVPSPVCLETHLPESLLRSVICS